MWCGPFVCSWASEAIGIEVEGTSGECRWRNAKDLQSGPRGPSATAGRNGNGHSESIRTFALEGQDFCISESEVNQWFEICPQGLSHSPLDSLKETIILPIVSRAKVLIDMNG